MVVLRKNEIIGLIGELIAAGALLLRGFRLIRWRMRFRGGEVDILAAKLRKLYVFEVKTSLFKGKQRFFRPETRIDARKLRAMFLGARNVEKVFHVKSGEVAVGIVGVELSARWPWLVVRVTEDVRYF